MIYFDNGATTFPKPESVYRAVNNAMRKFGANPGRSGHKMSLSASKIIYDCRVSCAKLFDIDSPENIIFTPNCTTALNTVIKGLLNKGDHVVISSLEHNAVVRPLEFLRTRGVEYSIADYSENDDETINNFRQALRPNTRLVICTHASNVFGVRLPVERIGALCKIYGILFCLDSAQTAGTVPISLKNTDINFLCTAGHKGLYGPMGTGLLVINSQTTPQSLIQGGTGSLSSERKQPELLPDKYESGTPNLFGIAGLGEGVRYVLSRTPEQLLYSEIELAKQFYRNLSALSAVRLYTKEPCANKNVPVLSFNIDGFDSEKTALLLSDRFNIATRAGLHCAPLAHEFFKTDTTGTVRVVFSSFNTKAQVDYLSKAVLQITKMK